MNDSSILPRQWGAFLLTAISAPAVAAASRLPWVWSLTVTILAAAAALCMCRLRPQNSPRWLAALQAVFLTVLLWHFALGADAAFPDENTVPFVPLTLLAVALWASSCGESACIRAVSVLFFAVSILYIIVFLSALKQMQWHRLAAEAPPTDLLPLGVVMLLPLLPTSGERKPVPTAFLIAFLLLPAAASAVCAAIPGSGGSFYAMAKSVEVLAFAQRIEPLVSVAQTVGWFAALCLILLTATHLLQSLGLTRRWQLFLPILISVPAIVLQVRIPSGILLLSGAVFCVILPLLAQEIVLEKKNKKRLKKSKKRC